MLFSLLYKKSTLLEKNTFFFSQAKNYRTIDLALVALRIDEGDVIFDMRIMCPNAIF